MSRPDSILSGIRRKRQPRALPGRSVRTRLRGRTRRARIPPNGRPATFRSGCSFSKLASFWFFLGSARFSCLLALARDRGGDGWGILTQGLTPIFSLGWTHRTLQLVTMLRCLHVRSCTREERINIRTGFGRERSSFPCRFPAGPRFPFGRGSRRLVPGDGFRFLATLTRRIILRRRIEGRGGRRLPSEEMMLRNL